jgi:hypothetical protein
MGELRGTCKQISHRVNAGLGRLHGGQIGHNVATVDLGARRIQADPLGDRSTADRNQHNVDLDRVVADGDDYTSFAEHRLADRNARVDLHTAPFEVFLELP